MLVRANISTRNRAKKLLLLATGRHRRGDQSTHSTSLSLSIGHRRRRRRRRSLLQYQ